MKTTQNPNPQQRLAAIRQAQAEEGQALHDAAREAAKAEKAGAMNERTQKQVVDLLRRAAERLEATDEQVLFPGWSPEPEFQDERHLGIQAAARAVLADGLSADEGTRVSTRSLGFLVHYVADMMEL